MEDSGRLEQKRWQVQRAIISYYKGGSHHFFSKKLNHFDARELANRWADPEYIVPMNELCDDMQDECYLDRNNLTFAQEALYVVVHDVLYTEWITCDAKPSRDYRPIIVVNPTAWAEAWVGGKFKPTKLIKRES